MSRLRVSKGQIIMKKKEKLSKVASIMPIGFTDDDFIEEFKKVYSKYWDNIIKRYNEHEKLTRPGETHPMPEPRKFLLNLSRKYIEDVRKKHADGWQPTEAEVMETKKKIEKENIKKEKPKNYQESTPDNIDELVITARSIDDAKRLQAVNELGKWKCQKSKDVLWRIMLKDSIYSIQIDAFKKLQTFGEDVKLPRKKKKK